MTPGLLRPELVTVWSVAWQGYRDLSSIGGAFEMCCWVFARSYSWTVTGFFDRLEDVRFDIPDLTTKKAYVAKFAILVARHKEGGYLHYSRYIPRILSSVVRHLAICHSICRVASVSGPNRHRAEMFDI